MTIISATFSTEWIRWGTAADWVGGLLTAGALILTYLLLRQQAKALDEQRAAMAADRVERQQVFFRTCAVTLRPVLRDAREVFAIITATRDVGAAWERPLTNPLMRDLADVRPSAAADGELAGHLDDVFDALVELWKPAIVSSVADRYGNEIPDLSDVGDVVVIAARGLAAAQGALRRLATLEAP